MKRKFGYYDSETEMAVGFPQDGKRIKKGYKTLQEVVLKKIGLHIQDFREAQRRIDAQRKSR